MGLISLMERSLRRNKNFILVKQNFWNKKIYKKLKKLIVFPKQEFLCQRKKLLNQKNNCNKKKKFKSRQKKKKIKFQRKLKILKRNSKFTKKHKRVKEQDYYNNN